MNQKIVSLIILLSVTFLMLFLITDHTYAEYKFIMKDQQGNSITYDKDKTKIIDKKKQILYAPVRIVFTEKNKKAGAKSLMVDFEEDKDISKMADTFGMLEIGLQIDYLDGYVKFISRSYYSAGGQLVAELPKLEDKGWYLAVGDMLKVLQLIKRDMDITDMHVYTDYGMSYYSRKWQGDVPAIELFYFHSKKKDALLCGSSSAKPYYMYKPEFMSVQDFYKHLETEAPKLLASCSEGNMTACKEFSEKYQKIAEQSIQAGCQVLPGTEAFEDKSKVDELVAKSREKRSDNLPPKENWLSDNYGGQ